MIKRSAISDRVMRFGDRKDARPADELMAVVTDSDVSDDELGTALVEAVNMSTVRFPFGWAEYNEVVIAAAATWPDSDVVHSVLAAHNDVAGKFLGEVVSRTSDRRFLDQVVRTSFRDNYNDDRPMRKAAFDRIASPAYAAELSVYGTGYAKSLGLAQVTDRHAVERALTNGPLSANQYRVLAGRFLDDPDFGPLIAASLIEDFKAADASCAIWQQTKIPGDRYGGRERLNQIQELMTSNYNALRTVMEHADPEMQEYVAGALQDMSSANGQHMVKQLLAPATASTTMALSR